MTKKDLKAELSKLFHSLGLPKSGLNNLDQVNKLIKCIEDVKIEALTFSEIIEELLVRDAFSLLQSDQDLSRYTFMNKDAELFDVVMFRGEALTVSNHRGDHLRLYPPLFLEQGRIADLVSAFNEWWRGRRIPASREGVKELLWRLKDDAFGGRLIESLEHLAEKAMGLSLSDQYWIRPEAQALLTWDEVNFFTNEFSDDIGNLLVQGVWNGGSLNSPDNTSDGVLKKRWKIIEGKRMLVKGGSSPVGYIAAQPRREVLAAQIAEVLLEKYDPDFVTPYYLEEFDGEWFSICPNFVTAETEYVQFNQLVQGREFTNYQEKFDYCRGFYGGKTYVMDLMLILDYIVLNEDRHTGNFGLIRCVKTGKYLSPAPIFDTGTSLFHGSIHTNPALVRAKPFHEDHEMQVRLVDVQLYKEALYALLDQVERIFDKVFEGSNEGEERLLELKQLLVERIECLIRDY